MRADCAVLVLRRVVLMPNDEDAILVTSDLAAKAFDAWLDDYQRDPKAFLTLQESRSRSRGGTYGERCTVTFFDYVEAAATS